MAEQAETPELWRILAVAEPEPGGAGFAYIRAFRETGHSVWLVPPERVVPDTWRSWPLRLLRWLSKPLLVNEYNKLLADEARRFKPHLFLLAHSHYVKPQVLQQLHAAGTVLVCLRGGTPAPDEAAFYDLICLSAPENEVEEHARLILQQVAQRRMD